jgi:hypothetical protein
MWSAYMSNRFTRGSAPGRARDASQRPGSFKPGHKKVGGRKKGMPNRISPDFKTAVLAAADRVGMDGKGKDGVVGYFSYLAEQYPAAYCKILSRVIDIEEVYPERSSPTSDQLNADLGEYMRTDCDQLKDALPDEMTIMAMKDPEAFSTAIAVLLPRPTKRRRHRKEYQDQDPYTRR